jgi:hypothetical protein
MWDTRAWHRWAQGRATCHKRCECVPQRQQRWVAAVPLPVAETRLDSFGIQENLKIVK